MGYGESGASTRGRHATRDDDDGEPVVPFPRRLVTREGQPSQASAPPLVIAVGCDASQQHDLVRRLDGTAVVVLVPDLDSAGPVLARLGSSTPTEEPSPGELPEGFAIDDRLRSVTWQADDLHLTDHEHELIALMAGDLERVWTHQQLHAGVWRDSYLPTTTHLQSTVKRLRRKLADAGVPLLIEAVRGVGYRLHRADLGPGCG